MTKAPDVKFTLVYPHDLGAINKHAKETDSFSPLLPQVLDWRHGASLDA